MFPRLTFTCISSNKSSVLVVYRAGGGVVHKMSDDIYAFQKNSFYVGHTDYVYEIHFFFF